MLRRLVALFGEGLQCPIWDVGNALFSMLCVISKILGGVIVVYVHLILLAYMCIYIWSPLTCIKSFLLMGAGIGVGRSSLKMLGTFTVPRIPAFTVWSHLVYCIVNMLENSVQVFSGRSKKERALIVP